MSIRDRSDSLAALTFSPELPHVRFGPIATPVVQTA
jgi:hypothetical protein